MSRSYGNFTIVLHNIIKEKMHTFNLHVQLRILKKTRKFCYWMRYIRIIILLWSSLLMLVYYIIQEKGKLFTGPVARQMIGAPGIGIPKPGSDFEYKVFIQNQSGASCIK